MQDNFFKIVNKSDPTQILEALFSSGEVTGIEKAIIPASGDQSEDTDTKEKYAIAIYTNGNILGKKGTRLVLSFDKEELREKAMKTIESKLTITVIEASWYIY
jgi:hypothetical protein